LGAIIGKSFKDVTFLDFLEERLKERGLERIVRVKSLSFMDERMKFSNCIYMARVLPSKVATAKNWHALHRK
jgi:hypothetical protein